MRTDLCKKLFHFRNEKKLIRDGFCLLSQVQKKGRCLKNYMQRVMAAGHGRDEMNWFHNFGMTRLVIASGSGLRNIENIWLKCLWKKASYALRSSGIPQWSFEGVHDWKRDSKHKVKNWSSTNLKLNRTPGPWPHTQSRYFWNSNFWM